MKNFNDTSWDRTSDLPICSRVFGSKKEEISIPVTGLEWCIGFQEVKVPRFHDNGTEWW